MQPQVSDACQDQAPSEMLARCCMTFSYTLTQGEAGLTMRICRISAQVYNSLDDYERLASVLNDEFAYERTL